jgi:hypothetical protein
VTPLVVGTVLALAALAFVLWPIFRVSWSGSSGPAQSSPDTAVRVPEGQSALDALREIEFDRATGKLSDADYATLRARYTSAAVSELRDADAAVAAGLTDDSAFDAAEELIRRIRIGAVSCSECGPRPEPDAIYCSNCGRFLAGACGKCGAKVMEPGARFCSSCGSSLAA